MRRGPSSHQTWMGSSSPAGNLARKPLSQPLQGGGLLPARGTAPSPLPACVQWGRGPGGI